MSNQPTKNEVVIVANPITGKMIDVLPMLRLLAENCYSSPDGGKEGYYLVDKVIEVLATGFDEDANISSVKDCVADLYRLKRAFMEMKES